MAGPSPQTAASPDERPQPLGGSPPAWRWDILWLGLIFIVALVVRLIYIWQARSSPVFDQPQMDPLFHHEWAQAFAAGETFWKAPYFRAPLYPWFLGVIHWLFGSDNLLAPRIIQAVIGSLSCGLLYLIGRDVFSRTVGVIAGLAAATYWIFMYFDAELLIPVLIVFLDLLLLWLLLRLGDRRRPVMWGVCGLVMGLSAIARPNILLLAPALVAWVFVLHRPHWRRALGYSFLLFIGCILPILPITIRNYVVGHEFVLIASQGGVNFYIGNNAHSDGCSAIIKGDPPQWWPCYEAQIARAEKAEGRKLTGTEVSRWYFRQALRFWRQQPAAAARLTIEKLGFFWSHWELTNNQDLRFVATHFTPIARYLPLGFWIVGPLGMLGVVLSLRRAKALFPLWGFVLIYMTSVVMFFVTARYRVPVAFVLILLGSHAVCWFLREVRARHWRALGLAGALLLVMALVAARTPPGVDEGMVQGHQQMGAALVGAGRYAEAEEILSEFVKRAPEVNHPINETMWCLLGSARFEQQKYAEAVPDFERALELRPYYPEARIHLVYCLLALNRVEEAVAHLEQLAQDDPQVGEYRASLAIALARLGRAEEASRTALTALETDAAQADALVETARQLRFQGRAWDALQLLRAAVEQSPGNPSVLAALIQQLANSADPAERNEALAFSERALQASGDLSAPVLHAIASAYAAASNRMDKAAEIERRALETARRDGPSDLIPEIELALRRYEAAAGWPGRPPATP